MLQFMIGGLDYFHCAFACTRPPKALVLECFRPAISITSRCDARHNSSNGVPEPRHTSSAVATDLRIPTGEETTATSSGAQTRPTPTALRLFDGIDLPSMATTQQRQDAGLIQWHPTVSAPGTLRGPHVPGEVW